MSDAPGPADSRPNEPADDLLIEQIRCGPMQNFVYVVGSRRTREVVLVDPAWAIDELVAHVEKQDLTVTGALATHYHPDHIGGSMGGHNIEGLAELVELRPVKIWVNKHDAEGTKKLTGLSDSDLVKVDSNDTLRLGDVEIEFMHTPGHTPGSQCFMARGRLVSGDTLFIQGCGRVDLPGSDPEAMYHSLRRLSQLPDDTVLFPGHDYGGGPHMRMGDTKRTNPYLRIDDPELWREMMGG